MKLRGILESALYCEDLDVCERFYCEVLGLERISAQEGRHVFFHCSDGILLLFDPRTTSTIGTEVNGSPIPLHGATGEGHLAFRCTLAEIEGWRTHLQDHQVEIESEVIWPGGGHSLYFRDPAGNSLEIATPELWQR